MIQNRKMLGMIGFLIGLAMCGAMAQAQAPHVTLLGGGSGSANAERVEAFRQGLHELGYTEGKNIIFEQRWADGKIDRLAALAAELVRLKVDIIVSAGPTVTRALSEVTSTIPIVMGFDDDPVGSGFVASLSRPGRNITGLSTLSPELSGKQLELLKEILPKVSRVAVFGSSVHPGTTQTLKEMESISAAFGVQIQYLEIKAPKEIEPAFRATRKAAADAIVVLTSVVTNTNKKPIVELAARNRLPAIYYTSEWAQNGGLLSYGANFPDLFRRAATYVDKILKGAKPGDLPVEQARKFELIVNLKAAKEIGLSIPVNVLARADRVIR
jgi:putative ABC transport system substrate-binding protein